MSTPEPGDERAVIITDVRIPFLSMVALLVKVTLAALPAFIFLAAIAALLMGLLGGYAALLKP
jgi:hypothetical protein